MLNRRQLFGMGAGLAAAIGLNKVLPAQSENSLQHAGIADPQTKVRATPYQMRLTRAWTPYGPHEELLRYDMLFRRRDGGVEQYGIEMLDRNDDRARWQILTYAGKQPHILRALPLDVDYQMGAYQWVAGIGEIV